MIDFSAVWGNFANIGENAVVFSVVVGTLIVYVLLLVWARRKDKQDKIRVCFSLYRVMSSGNRRLIILGLIILGL